MADVRMMGRVALWECTSATENSRAVDYLRWLAVKWETYKRAMDADYVADMNANRYGKEFDFDTWLYATCKVR